MKYNTAIITWSKQDGLNKIIKNVGMIPIDYTLLCELINIQSVVYKSWCSSLYAPSSFRGHLSKAQLTSNEPETRDT